MNIFEALSNGKGCVNEENISSFLAYLLQQDAGHDLKDEFLKRFIKLIENQTDLKKIYDCYDKVSVDLEEFFEIENDKPNKYIDISVRINDEIYIGIENKISKNAIQKGQFVDEYKGVKLSYKYSRGKQVIMVLLAPDEKAFRSVYNELKVKDKDKKAFISWDDICEIIKDMLNDEKDCKINPISDYTKMTLKAFVCYIKNVNNPILRNIVKVTCSNKEKYTICQLSNRKVYIKENEDLIVKHLIFDVLHQLNTTQWYDFDKQKYELGPQNMGDKMFELLNGKEEIKLKENIVFCSDKFRKKNK